MIVHYEKELFKALDDVILQAAMDGKYIARIDLDEIETKKFLDLYPSLLECGVVIRTSPPYAPRYYTYYYKKYELKLAKV